MTVPAAAGGRAACAPRPALGPLAVGAAAASALAYVAVVDPNRPGHYLVCPVLALTGWSCPACGGLRATHDLTRLDLAAAWSANPLWVMLAPVLVAAWAAWLVRALRGQPRPPGARAGTRVPARALVVLGVVVAFGVLRNVPVLAPTLGP
ncbi:DUF2752 domain-containing protein [Cellulomonas sp. PhB143]|uniref:DUF2752 domain-containing protein n=1 Tax=Cellulomonas sp. PhB143 TaxID=2485186 RepID=UPI000F470732|nr:DUF2752 domain-containing protein [Cellulomonas sp. PhB143]ROS74391.1 uncharacterized protein DUF2752 [Cellulomonas sp. PhB143]